ncbi:MAG: HypC/HybG/HupF family hydrogenase formation chaperone [Bryobacteraceae bacterium]
MCLAIPGKVVEFHDTNGVRMAKVDFGGITREACLEYVPETRLGEYVMVHVGFAIAKVDEEEAARTYSYLEEMDQLGELYDADSERHVERTDEVP